MPRTRLILLPALAVLAAAAAGARGGRARTTLESAGPAGVPGDAPSGASSGREVALSGDGRFLAFTSEATRTSWRATATRRGTSSSATAGAAPPRAWAPAARPACRPTAASSSTPRPPASGAGGKRRNDVYLHDRRSGRTTRVSNRHPAARGRRVSAFRGAISPDGRYVAYAAVRTIGSGGQSDTVSLGVFLYDRATGRTARVAGEQAQDSAGVSLSRGRALVAFVTTARLTRADRNRLPDAYVLDRRSGRVTLASRGPAAARPTAACSIRSSRPAATGWPSSPTPGRSRLAPGGRGYKVFVRDLRAGRTVLAGVGAGGEPLTGDATSAALSGDGRFVAFQVSPLDGPIGDFEGPFGEVLVRDLARGKTVAASDTPAGAPSERSGFPALSADGRFVAFTSAAALVEGDANGLMDVFVRGPLR